jgi:hypothetical protein
MRFFLDNKLECLNQRDHKLQQDQANYRYVGANSQKLLGRIRQRGFKQVFDILDDDKVSNKSGPWFDILTCFSFRGFESILVAYIFVCPGWPCQASKCKFTTAESRHS